VVNVTQLARKDSISFVIILFSMTSLMSGEDIFKEKYFKIFLRTSKTP
jgi:hypothetical protein